MKRLLTIISVLLVASILAFGQDLASNNEKKAAEKKIAAPVASPITDEAEIKEWNALQSARRENQAVLDQLVYTARLAKYKTADTKAQLWGDLETAFLRGQRDDEADAAFLVKMQEKYACPKCVIDVAPDQKTLVIKPKPAEVAKK